MLKVILWILWHATHLLSVIADVELSTLEKGHHVFLFTFIVSMQRLVHLESTHWLEVLSSVPFLVFPVFPQGWAMTRVRCSSLALDWRGSWRHWANLQHRSEGIKMIAGGTVGRQAYKENADWWQAVSPRDRRGKEQLHPPLHEPPRHLSVRLATEGKPREWHLPIWLLASQGKVNRRQGQWGKKGWKNNRQQNKEKSQTIAT